MDPPSSPSSSPTEGFNVCLRLWLQMTSSLFKSSFLVLARFYMSKVTTSIGPRTL